MYFKKYFRANSIIFRWTNSLYKTPFIIHSFVSFRFVAKFIHYAATIWKSFACAHFFLSLPFILITFPWFIDYIFRNTPFLVLHLSFRKFAASILLVCVGCVNPITRWDVIYCWDVCMCFHIPGKTLSMEYCYFGWFKYWMMMMHICDACGCAGYSFDNENGV